MKSTRKQPLKKGNPFTIAQQYSLDFNHQFKSITLKIETWHPMLADANRVVDEINLLLTNKQKLNLTEIHKKILNTKKMIAKINKEIESLQRQAAKSQVDFEQHFESPLLEKQFSNKEPAILESAQQTIINLKTLFETQRQLFLTVVHPCQTTHRRLVDLEDQFNSFCLPEEIKESSQQSAALNQRLASIYQTLSSFNTDHPARATQNLSQTFLPLVNSYTEQGEWLHRINALAAINNNTPILTEPSSEQSQKIAINIQTVIEQTSGLQLN